ncbi:MAG: MFS transporter [Pseudonocardia sp.]|nr:MFS transporter [Pseudonocardia sp.]ODU10304.1 MAG: cyanate transporter [Pseudonocardia sp. SCN 72-51]ODV05243.1 MAG: cyanate transporter [Pseudonocardia sp. SCN 73-27]
MSDAGPATRRVGAGVVLVGVLAVAANLRASLAGYPPLIESVRDDLAIGAGAAGLVQSGAILMMALGSFVGPRVSARTGRERGLGWSVALIAVGSLLRAVPTLPTLVVASLLIGLGIGLAGVQLTGVVKHHLAERAGAVTGGYVVSMMVGATVASAIAVPLAVGLGGWSWSMAVWTVPAVLAFVVWMPIAGRISEPATAAPRLALPWRDPFARRCACYQAGTSTMFYGWITWLAPYYESQSWTPQRAGILLAAWSITQIPAALLVPALAERHRRWRFWATATVTCGIAGTLGAMLLPQPPGVGPWAWAVLMGVGMGAGFPLGLAVIAWRTPDGHASAAVSGLALGVGYVAAGLAPLLMGLLIDVTDGYRAAIAVLVAGGLLQAGAIWRIGDEPRSPAVSPTSAGPASPPGP